MAVICVVCFSLSPVPIRQQNWFLLSALLVGYGCSPKALPNNSACLTKRQAGLGIRQQHALRTFLVLGTPDSMRPQTVDYRQYCVSYTVSERQRLGLFKVTKVGDAAWPARFFIKVPRHLLLLYARKTRLVKTYTVAEAVASPNCQLSTSTKEDIVAYITAQ